jgi:hypothetical protein
MASQLLILSRNSQSGNRDDMNSSRAISNKVLSGDFGLTPASRRGYLCGVDRCMAVDRHVHAAARMRAVDQGATMSIWARRA